MSVLTHNADLQTAAPLTERHERAAARSYGRRAATQAGLQVWSGDEPGPLFRADWASYHDELCTTADRQDWRLRWPDVEYGWTHYHTFAPKEDGL